MRKKTRDTSKRNMKGWLVLFITAVICVILAISLKINFEDNKADQTKQSENNNEQKTEQVASQNAVVDLNDYMNYNVVVPTMYKQYEPIRGIYLTANTAGISSRLDNLIKIANDTEVNAFVIDVKNDEGNITYDMNVPLADEIGAEYHAIGNIQEVMDKLYDNNIYPIARIVAFKDPYLSSIVTDFAIKNKDGSLFKYKGFSWINPYNKDSWKYIIDVAKEAARAGFKEIQFDYIRFEATSSLNNADFGNNTDTTESRMEIIVDFVDYAKQELAPFDVAVSADVFGTIISSEVDAKNIGQNYIEMAKRLDVICPMVYPSHYGRGYFGLPSSEPPDLHPYEIIKGSMTASNEVLSKLEGNRVIVRPWLQAFTASYLGAGNYMRYGGKEIRSQIQAAYDTGLTEWLLWNPTNKYTQDGLQPQ